jgi:hypothetical protein
MENVASFCGHRIYFVAISYILFQFGIYFSVHFTRFGMSYQEKSGNPAILSRRCIIAFKLSALYKYICTYAVMHLNMYTWSQSYASMTTTRVTR